MYQVARRAKSDAGIGANAATQNGAVRAEAKERSEARREAGL